MKRLYTLIAAVILPWAGFAQTTIDISAIDQAYTVEFDGATVIDLATTTSAVASPKLSYDNPFKGQTFSEAEISFDVYTYEPDSIKVLGSLLAFYDAALGRMYFSNGSYLGFNIGADLWFDANLNNFAIDQDFIGTGQWRTVQLQFDTTGYAMYVDGTLAFDNTSTNVTIAGPLSDYSLVIDFLQNASTLVFGTGSWWSDNTRTDGSYWDAQFSYLKNITFTQDFSTTSIDDEFRYVGEPVNTLYYNINGAEVSKNFSELAPGIYLKKEFFRNGAVRATKVGKAY